MRWQITIYILLVMASATVALAGISDFVETFDGNGPYESVDGQFDGLDNPGWNIFGDGIARFQDGGLYVENVGSPEGGSVTVVEKSTTGSGSFAERVEIKNPDLGIPVKDDTLGANSLIGLNHVFDLEDRGNHASIEVIVRRGIDEPQGDVWQLLMLVNDSGTDHEVSPGDHLAFEIIYDAVLSQTSFTFDNDINDNVPATEYGPFQNSGRATEHQDSRLSFTRTRSASPSLKSNGLLDYWSLTDLIIPGDYDDDHVLTVADVDLLMLQVREGPFGSSYDLNDDGTLDSSDVRVWVEDLKGTWLGDANLDGEFNSSDLVQIFENGQYEDGIALNSTWATGDWNADAEFDSGDLVFAFAGGGYEFGPRAEASVIPEPSSFATLLAGVIGIAIVSNTHRKSV